MEPKHVYLYPYICWSIYFVSEFPSVMKSASFLVQNHATTAALLCWLRPSWAWRVGVWSSCSLPFTENCFSTDSARTIWIEKVNTITQTSYKSNTWQSVYYGSRVSVWHISSEVAFQHASDLSKQSQFGIQTPVLLYSFQLTELIKQLRKVGRYAIIRSWKITKMRPKKYFLVWA